MHCLNSRVISGYALLLGATLWTLPASAQLPPPEEKPAVGAKMPALSPDGKRIAFVWRGDIWIGNTTGGQAYPVTSHVEQDAYPIFSPDGKWLAFSSQRNGNWDIFVVPTSGGTARQMTFSSASEIASDWSPDGKTLLYSSGRDLAPPNDAIFALDVKTLRFQRLTEDYRGLNEAVYSPDGKKLAFQRDTFPWTRPRYNGSRAAQLWTLDLAEGKRKEIDANGRQHLWPRFTADGKSILVVTTGEETPNAQYLNKPLLKLEDNEKRTPNLWLYPANGGAARQVTRFVGDGVRFPAVARQSGDVAFEYGQNLYLLPAKGKEPVKLTFFCGADEKQNNIARQVFTNSDVEEAEISPDGKTFAFVIRGDLWMIPVEKAKTRNATDATRLTDFPGFDRDFVWSKDGKTIFFISDRGGSDGLYALDVATKAVKTLWTGKEDVRNPQITPDGTQVGFWVEGSITPDGGGTGGLYMVPAVGGTAKRVLSIPAAAQSSFQFSPDNKWVAFVRRNVESNAYNIYIAPLDGSKPPVNITRRNASHSEPVWSPEGKYLFFRSNREDGLGVTGNAFYMVPLKPEEARTDELELKYEKPKTPVEVAIEFEDIEQRIHRMPVTPTPDGGVSISDDGTIFFVSGGDVYTTSYDGKETKRITTTGGTPANSVRNLRVAADGKSISYFRAGGLYTGRMAPPYTQTAVTFVATWERDVRAERLAAFNQFWRGYNNNFYDANFHGRDWAAIKTRYEPLLDGVGTPTEFAQLLNRMIGEVEASHSEVRAGRSPITGPETRSLGVYFDYSYNGPGIKVQGVPKRAPGSYPKTRIKPGEYILEVDGKPVTLDENLYKALNDKGDRDFVLLVNDKPTRDGARTVTYRAMTAGEWSSIHYQNRIERLRKAVDEKSKGNLAYVHIQGMGDANQALFEKELYEYAEGKKGLIIDVRFNGGGSIADNLLNWLAIKPYRIRFSRNDYPPKDVNFNFFVREVHLWDKPIVVLMNEYSLSNAEIFPYVMRENKLAKIVGRPTPGYVISTGGLSLVDGTLARMPGGGNFRKDGSPMENLGEKPDYDVELTTEDWLTDRDPQLEKAIEILLK